MTWQELLAQRRVEKRPSSLAELAELRALAERELSDARAPGLSPEGKFEHAYASARARATMVIRSEGYRPTSTAGHHYNTFLALVAADAGAFSSYEAYFNLCRVKYRHPPGARASGAAPGSTATCARDGDTSTS